MLKTYQQSTQVIENSLIFRQENWLFMKPGTNQYKWIRKGSMGMYLSITKEELQSYQFRPG